MKIESKSIKKLIYAIFSDFPLEDCHTITVEKTYTGHIVHTRASGTFSNDGLFISRVTCCTDDEYNIITGAALVLAKLRENVLSYRNRQKKERERFRPWIPMPLQPYYTVINIDDSYEVTLRYWSVFEKGSQTDVINLYNGTVFKTAREARKYIRRKEQESRTYVNKWRK